LYRAGDFAHAEAAFARVEGPDGSFWLGNARAKKGDYPAAVAAYDLALKVRPEFPQAQANRALVQALIPPDDSHPDQPNEKPDEVQFDEKGKKGKPGQVPAARLAAQDAELWLRRLRPSPAKFLEHKFRAQADRETSGAEASP